MPDEYFTLRYETRLVPIVPPEPLDPEIAQQVQAHMRRTLDTLLTQTYERALFGRPVTGITVIEGVLRVVPPPLLPPGGDPDAG